MAKKESLREHLNRKLKEKGTTLAAEKKKAEKYKLLQRLKKVVAFTILIRMVK